MSSTTTSSVSSTIAPYALSRKSSTSPNYQGNAVVNYTEREVPYTRVIEHKHFEMFGAEVYDMPEDRHLQGIFHRMEGWHGAILSSKRQGEF